MIQIHQLRNLVGTSNRGINNIVYGPSNTPAPRNTRLQAHRKTPSFEYPVSPNHKAIAFNVGHTSLTEKKEIVGFRNR